MKKYLDSSLTNFRKTLIDKLGLKIKASDTILDLGCGQGTFASLFSKKAHQVIALDIKSFPCWKKYKLKNLCFIKADANNLPFADNYFDIIFVNQLIHHLNNPKRYLQEIKRVAKKNSVIYIIEANRYNPIQYFHMTKLLGHNHLTRIAFKKLIREKFNKVDFKAVECRVYPLISKYKRLMKIIHFLESLIEKVPLINNFTTFTAAIIKNC